MKQPLSIPNGTGVRSSGRLWSGVGHTTAAGGSSLNPFGEDFKAAGFKWTTALCEKDSDCDGLTNGEELGDPSCVWKEGDTPTRVDSISHPGIGNGVDCNGDKKKPVDDAAYSKYRKFFDMDTFIQIHVMCMYISWGFLLPAGALIAMCFRNAFKDGTMWFQLHVVFQMTGMVLMVVGTIVIFMYTSLHFDGVHKILGLVAFIIGILQVLNAFFRPKHSGDEDETKSTSRYLWELFHKNGGRLVIVLAWVNVFLGIRLLESLHGASPTLGGALAAVQGTIIAILTAVAVWRKVKGDSGDGDVKKVASSNHVELA